MATPYFCKFTVGALLGMLLTISVQAAPVSSTPYFFRTNVMNSDGSTEDLLSIGADRVAPMQNTTAIATQGETELVLLNLGANELGARLLYNPAQLGSWTITVINGPDTTTNVTHDLSEVQALPFVSNIHQSGSLLTPTLTWALPATSVPYTRIRVRIMDFAGGALVFTSPALPTSTTTYTLPSDVLQPDRDYMVRIMLEEVQGNDLFNRSDTRVTYTTYNTPVTISRPDVYYFRRAVRQPGSPDWDEILLDAVSVTPSAGATVTARSLVDSNVNENLNFAGCGVFPNEFTARFPFDKYDVNVTTGGFTITAENGGIQDQVTTHDIVGVQPLAFVENVNIAGNPLAPTVSWTLPVATAPFTEIRVRVWEIDANFCILSSFFSPHLPVTTTTYSVPSGVLMPDSDRYQIQIRLSEIRNGATVNRSEVRVAHSTVGANSVVLITHYYVSILGREPDADGLAFWKGLIAEKQATGEDVKPVFRDMANFFFNSPEYLGNNTTDRQFITNLYLTFFQREPDEGGYAFWLEQLASGMARNTAMAGFLYSPEFTDFMLGLGF